MLFEEKAKKLIFDGYQKGVLTTEMFADAGFTMEEMDSLINGKRVMTLYEGDFDDEYREQIYSLVTEVLGKDWESQREYQLGMNRKYNLTTERYYLRVEMTETEHEELVNLHNERGFTHSVIRKMHR